MLPESIQPDLREHLKRARIIHERDLTEGFGRVFQMLLSGNNTVASMAPDQHYFLFSSGK